MNTDPAQGHFLAELCAAKAGEDWKDAAYAFFTQFAQRNRYLTTAQVRSAFEAQGGAVAHDGRAWGHVCLRAQREGVVIHSGKYVRDGSHGRPNPVWESLFVRAA